MWKKILRLVITRQSQKISVRVKEETICTAYDGIAI